MSFETPTPRVAPAVHARQAPPPDPEFELGLTEHLRAQYDRDGLIELLARFAMGEGAVDMLMRRAIWRALARRFGHGVRIGSGAGFKHLERFEIGAGIFIGAQVYLQGRFDGQCLIGDGVWIGPQCYFDARDLIIGDHVGWGPGAKVLGATHTGLPGEAPIIETDQVIRPVRVGAWADIGTGAILLPGVTVGRGSLVGAGAVVTADVPDFAVVAGVPARFVRWREDTPHPEGPTHVD